MTDKLKPCPFCGGEAELRTGAIGKTIEDTITNEKQARCSTHGCLARFVVCTISEWQERAPRMDETIVECHYRTLYHHLLDAVRAVLAAIQHRENQYGHKVGNAIAGSLCIEFRMALTRIIADAENLSVTKKVGTGSVAKKVTVTPDE